MSIRQIRKRWCLEPSSSGCICLLGICNWLSLPEYLGEVDYFILQTCLTSLRSGLQDVLSLSFRWALLLYGRPDIGLSRLGLVIWCVLLTLRRLQTHNRVQFLLLSGSTIQIMGFLWL